MKDFDFDELDRAVSSALGGQGAPTAVQSSGHQEPSLEVPERQAIQKESPAPVRQRTPLRPNTGRAMDVVRPTSGGAPAVLQQKEASLPSTPEPAVVTPRQEVPMNDVTMVPRSSVMPDMQAAVAEETPRVQDEVTPEQQGTPSSEDDTSWSAVQESPFLPDAKVEKRPLGASYPTGASAAEPEPVAALADTQIDSNDSLVNDINALLAEDAAEEATQSSSEVQASEQTVPLDEKSDLAAVEPAPVDERVEPPVVTEDVEAESVPEFDEVITMPAESDTVVDSPAAPQTNDEAFTGPVSITPQYTAKPSSVQESGEIFDTESYHQPIAVPAKKKGGPLKIILIITLITVLGLGLGAGVYFYVLPML